MSLLVLPAPRAHRPGRLSPGRWRGCTSGRPPIKKLCRAVRTLLFAVTALSVGPLGGPADLLAQEPLTIDELESLYRAATAGYQEAFETLEVLTSQWERVNQQLLAAQTAGDEDAVNEAYEESLILARRRRGAQTRVEEEAEELRDVRERLREAHSLYLEELLLQSDTTSDPMVQRELGVLLSSTRTRVRVLLMEEDPPVSLPPMANITIEPRDGREQLLAKAALLERSVTQLQSQFTYNEERLAALRRDQGVLRRADDALADASRFGDLTMPVGPPTSGAVTSPRPPTPTQAVDTTGAQGPPLSPEERISAMEALQEEITQMIQDLQGRARMIRLRAGGGEWAQ